MIEITIPGRLIGLNDYIEIERGNKFAAAKAKKGIELSILRHIREQLPNSKPFKGPVRIYYRWVESNARRDKDNIAFAKKFIQDALVKAGVLENDGWRYIAGFADDFEVDKNSPRVEITIEEL